MKEIARLLMKVRVRRIRLKRRPKIKRRDDGCV